MRTIGVIAALGVMLAPSLASAHPVPGAMGGNPFRIIDRPDPHNAFGLDFAVGGLVGDDSPDELIAFRFDLHGRALVAESIGIFASLPISAFTILSDMDTGEDDGELGIGNIELGGFFLLPLGPSYETMLVLRGSLTLPTASDDAGFVANILGAEIGRLTDVILAVPQLFALRASGSLIHDAPGLTLRVDGGVDLPIESTVDGFEVDNDPVFRLNAGAAFGGGPTRLVAELATLADENSFEEEGDFLTQLAAGVTSQTGDVLVGASLTLLLDSVIEDDVDGAVLGVVATASTKF